MGEYYAYMFNHKFCCFILEQEHKISQEPTIIPPQRPVTSTVSMATNTTTNSLVSGNYIFMSMYRLIAIGGII